MIQVLKFLQIFFGLLALVLILLQQRGVSGGAFFGMKTEFFTKRRGMERYIFILTWFFIALFVILAYLRTKL